MRLIKFRGKAILNRYNLENYPNINEEWVYGYYVKCRGDHYILQEYNKDSGFDERWETGEWIEVYEESVGQFIGMLDKNGEEIYEGDIVEYKTMFSSPKWTKEKGVVRQVDTEWLCGDANFYDMNMGHEETLYVKGHTVVGNIIDTPELLNQK